MGSGYSPEEERRCPPDRCPRLRTRPSVARCTLDPLLLSAYARANTSRLNPHCPSHSCEGPISCRSDCPRCGHTKLRQIAAWLLVGSLLPYPVMIRVRGREARVRCARRHPPAKSRTRVLLVIVGEHIFRHQSVENCWLLGMKVHWDHRKRHRGRSGRCLGV